VTCVDDGVLRARLDGELPSREESEVSRHLVSCAICQGRFEELTAEKTRTAGLLAVLAPAGDGTAIDPAASYARFRNQLGAVAKPAPSWTTRLFASRWRPVWGLAAGLIIVAALAGIEPVRGWAQRILAMLRVQKITVVTVDPGNLMSHAEPDSRPYKLINQFIADNVVVTMDPGKPAMVSSVTQAAKLAGYRIRTIASLGSPQTIRVSGETAFQMTVNRERLATLLDEVGRSDIRIPESADGALIAVHIPKTVVSMYGDCPLEHSTGSSPRSPEERRVERMANMNRNCTYLVQAPSPTVSVPPDLNMAEIAEAALELAGMSAEEARSFCQTVDWSSTMVIPIPRNTSYYENLSVDGVEGTLITETLPEGSRYSLLWVKSGVIHSLSGRGNLYDARAMAASLRE
jgi:hypothetical protein